MGTRFFLQFEDGRFWHWYFADASGNVVAMSSKPYFVLADALQEIENLRAVLAAIY